ncbi:double-cubane-cluster-containing anaerobic reductase [Treponema endosymbiont of Eucomonympha sp.]|uniref:double-cubane-cluster-containing anaerobic reductase n=1 Tax=Treponema endosymbiont of Eucomonympha sp. TaxID=1580831 RepID=UPI0007516046|nr:double-cubane-cluster-containing anaerobic reductase [Treponema endosymbiont of Eucomonympha sp.]
MSEPATRALPEIFESFSDARKQGFMVMKNLKEQGKGVVGTFCSYVPVELIIAAGLIPVGLCSTSDETIPEAEKILPRNLCPLIKASYGFALSDKCPYMYFSDMVVGETTCDGKIKMYELLGKFKDVYVMELPRTQHKEAARRFWLGEIKSFKEKLEQKFGVTITDDTIRAAIKERNRERALLKQVYELSALQPPPIPGLRQLQILYGAQFKFVHEEKVRELEETVALIKEEYRAGNRPVSETAKRIIITGCPIGGVTEKVARIIEESGGVVTVYENCTGAKQFDRQVDESADPYEALCEYYLAIGCSVMTPNPNRFELLARLCAQFAPQGVIEMVLQSCHTYAVETQTVREFLKSKNMPFFSLETDYSTGDTEQLRTRIAAFIEML